MKLPKENYGDVIKLVTLLASAGNSFRISTDHPVNPRGSSHDGKAEPDEESFTIRGEDSDCIEWAYVPGEGLKCVKRRA